MRRLANGDPRAFIVAALLLGLLGAARADAQVRCGDVIGPNAHVTLAADLSCGPGAPALSVVGPATLDLNGFSIRCEQAGAQTARGIVVRGRHAEVHNGSVQLCASGVEVRGRGVHRIERVVAAVNGSRADGSAAGRGHGFIVASEGNRLSGNIALQNDGDGFRVHGDRNRLLGNRAFLNGGTGFELLATRQSLLRDNVAAGNASFGFSVDGGTLSPGVGRNLLEGNTATGNATGFLVARQEATRLCRNHAAGNRRDGIVLASGRRNRLDRNRAEANGRNGIVVADSANTVLTRNTSLHHDPRNDGSRFDMLDAGEPDCGDNRWRGNVFATSNAACIE